MALKFGQDFRIHVLDRRRQNSGKEDDRIVDKVEAEYQTRPAKY
jgi:hypothetical protein